MDRNLKGNTQNSTKNTDSDSESRINVPNTINFKYCRTKNFKVLKKTK